MFREIFAECCIHGFGIVKCFRDVRGEKHDVRAAAIFLEVFAANSAGSGGLLRNVVVFPILTHTIFVQRTWPVAQR